MMSDEVRFRLATHADYRAVIDINTEIYGGHDYLPILYHTLLRDKNVTMMLAEVNGKVVSLCSKRHCIKDIRLLNLNVCMQVGGIYMA